MIDLSKIEKFKDLSERQKRFCLEYISATTGKDAAIKAGYSEKSASKQASTLLNDIKIVGIIEQIRQATWNEESLSLAEAKAILARKARADIGKVIDNFGNIDPVLIKKNSAMLSQYDIEHTEDGTNRKVKLPDPIQAIKLAAQLEHWTDKKDVNEHQLGGVKIIMEIPK